MYLLIRATITIKIKIYFLGLRTAKIKFSVIQPLIDLTLTIIIWKKTARHLIGKRGLTKIEFISRKKSSDFDEVPRVLLDARQTHRISAP